MNISVNVLGPLVIQADGRHLKLPRKAGALLAYLAVHKGQRVSRELLADLLWPHQITEASRHSLRNCLLEVKKACGTVLIADFTHCQFVADSDADHLEEVAVSHDIAELKRFAALYRGQLLEGLAINDEGWKDWLGPERSRINDLATAVLFRLAKLASAAGDHKTAIANVRRVIQIEPFCELAHRLLMHVLAAAGRAPEALRHFGELAELLKAELGIRPSAETDALRAQIKSRLRPGEAEPDHPPGLQLTPPLATLHNLPQQLRALTEAALPDPDNVPELDLQDLEDLPRQLQAVVATALRMKGAIERVLEARKSPALVRQAA
jgi:DNA-binding SARP family transcriptional activator